MAEQYDRSEQDKVIEEFTKMLWLPTGDGGTKRAAGTKPPWYEDDSHLEHFWNHIEAYDRDVIQVGHFMPDPDSGAHPFIHAAWRLLAIAYQETRGKVAP